MAATAYSRACCSHYRYVEVSPQQLRLCQTDSPFLCTHSHTHARTQELAQAVHKQAQHLAALSQQLLLGLLQQQQQQGKDVPASSVALLASLCDRHRMAVTSLMMATAPFSLPGMCVCE